MRRFYFLWVFGAIFWSCTAQKEEKVPKATETQILPGANQIDEYLPLIQGKKVGLVTNHTAVVGSSHLVDTLLSLNINILKVFTPEHGFTGTKPDGEKIEKQESDYDFELISLYRSNRAPTEEELQNLEVIIFDIQDVGVRFYTYPSTMTYVMRACAQYDIPFIVFDRPNPHGAYIDGPVMQEEYKSFIGMHSVPLVHGLTIGELAKMINEEGWLGDSLKCDLTVIKNMNWTHDTPYSLPVPPSPNLPNDLSIALYPSLGLFERTLASVGRGTDFQFQVIGHPNYPDTSFSFTPMPNEGSKYPPLEGQKCYGVSFVGSEPVYEFNISFLIDFYKKMKGRTEEPFIMETIYRHIGNKLFKQQIEDGLSETEIRATWKADLDAFQQLRKKYLIYE
ncbi:MAG: exo-beta-N-acetylmuramidase NamZ domain-containing protein [Bacteroidota bacterium]